MSNPPIIVSLNYLVTIICFYFSFLLYKKNDPKLYKGMIFIFYFGVSFFLGGIYHYMENNATLAKGVVTIINQHLPALLLKVDFDSAMTRLWFLLSITVGLSSYFFIRAFLEPRLKSPAALRSLLFFTGLLLVSFILISILDRDFFFTTIFNLVTIIFFIASGLIAYFREKINAGLGVVLLGIYVIGLSIMQQLMEKEILSSGPLNLNDWYHIGTLVFPATVYYLMTRTSLLRRNQ